MHTYIPMDPQFKYEAQHCLFCDVKKSIIGCFFSTHNCHKVLVLTNTNYHSHQSQTIIEVSHNLENYCIFVLLSLLNENLGPVF